MSRYFKRVVALSKRPEDFRHPKSSPAQSVVASPPTTVVGDAPATVITKSTTTVSAKVPLTFPDRQSTTVVADLSTPIVDATPGPMRGGHEQQSPAVVADSLTTVVGGSTTTVAAALWQAEANGAVFPASRLRRIERAQDALTHSEEAVYDFLWGRKNIDRDEYRFTEVGYDRIANAARITKRNAALVVERLIEKGFLRIERPPDPMHRVPTRYRVLGYRAALDEIHRRGREWVVRTGNGVLFVRPVTVVTYPPTTVVAGPPSTVVAAATVEVVADEPTTVVTATTPLDSTQKTGSQSSSSSIVSTRIARYIQIDDDAVLQLIRRCRAADDAATEEEIAHFAEAKIHQLKGRRNIENWVGMLLTSVPQYFSAPATEVTRYREAKAVSERQSREANNQLVHEGRKTLDDPNASESDKALVRSWIAAIEGDT